MSEKYQSFIDPIGDGNIEILSEYHPEENVWTSVVCLPHEWNTQREMRIDMLIHILAEEDSEMTQMMQQWDCQSEDALLDRYENYLHTLKQNYDKEN